MQRFLFAERDDKGKVVAFPMSADPTADEADRYRRFYLSLGLPRWRVEERVSALLSRRS